MKPISKRYTLPHPVDKVFAAWVSSDTVVPPATKMDILPKVGGHYRLIMEGGEFTGRNEGTFSVVEPGKRVVYSWEWNKDGEVTQIDVRFQEGANGTIVQLEHDGFQKAESRALHDSGWDSYIDGFKAVLARQ